MNLAFYITPVADVVWVELDWTVARALQRMREQRYSAVPVLDADGRYVGTLTEGDVLWALLDRAIDPAGARVRDLDRHVENQPVSVVTDLRDVVGRAADQNFVPVVDSRGVLMGIVTRRVILSEYAARVAGRPTAVDDPNPD